LLFAEHNVQYGLLVFSQILLVSLATDLAARVIRSIFCYRYSKTNTVKVKYKRNSESRS